MVEEEELFPFLEVYEQVTGARLSFVVMASRGESPDFICLRPSGKHVGVELTKVMRDPRDTFIKEEMDPYMAQELIFRLLEKKEKARADLYSKAVGETILVLQLVDGSLDSLRVFLEDIKGEFIGYGFSEIWLADYSGIEAYGDIELFGLFPEKWWGYQQNLTRGWKPYG